MDRDNSVSLGLCRTFGSTESSYPNSFSRYSGVATHGSAELHVGRSEILFPLSADHYCPVVLVTKEVN